MDINEVKTDLDAAEDGVWFSISETAKAKIARWSNVPHKTFMRKINRKYGQRMEAGAMTDEEVRDVMAGQYPHLIRDWKGVTMDGEEIKYSPQTIIDLAKNPQLDAFFARIQNIAKSEENFMVGNIKAMGEDSPAT